MSARLKTDENQIIIVKCEALGYDMTLPNHSDQIRSQVLRCSS